jgi:integrase
LEIKMAAIKLTEAVINKLRPNPEGGQTLYWDSQLRGFGVLVGQRGATYIVQRRLPNGNTRRVSIAPVSGTPLAEARTRAATVVSQFMQGTDPKAKRREEAQASATLQSVLDHYLVARKGLSPTTVKLYRGWIEDKLGDWLDLPLRRITPEMVDSRFHEIGKPATANATLRVFRILWNWACDRDPTMPERSPTRTLKGQWYDIAPRERIVKGDDLPAFYGAVDALPNKLLRDVILLALFSGLRRTEVVALNWSEVDFAERVIRLPARRTKAGRKLDLPMTTFVRDLLVARRALGNAGGWCFPSSGPTGHVMSPQLAFEAIAEASGVRVSMHDLRRTYITLAEGCDISPLALKALVNHSLGDDVTSHYVRMTVERLREPAQRVCDRLMELCGLQRWKMRRLPS